MDLWIGTLTIDETVYPVLKELKESHKVGLVTISHQQSYHPRVHRILGRFNLKPFFATVVVSSECGWKKPSPNILEVVLNNLSSLPVETIFVGDDCEGDISGAKQVGMKTVFKRKKGNGCEMADVAIDSMAELPSVARRF